MKKKTILLFLLSVILVVFLNNNYFLYETPIITVTNVVNGEITNEEKYTQTITGVLKNTEYIGEEYILTNEINISLVYCDEIFKGDNLFINISKDGSLINNSFEIKRDNYLGFLLILFIDMLLIIGGKKGFKTLMSFIINILLLICCIYLYINTGYSFSILLIYILLTPLLIGLSILIPNGFNKKSYCAILSSIFSITVCFILSYILLYFFDDGLFYYTMDYVEVVSDYKGVFYVSILLSGLGAIMDISITIASSLNEIINKNPKITTKNLKISCENISSDIMGTMINVLFFTCFISVVPTIIFVVRNNMNIYNAINVYGQIQLVIILISCIGVILSIPISQYITLYILRRKKA